MATSIAEYRLMETAHGLNRSVSPVELSASESPSCADCRSVNKTVGWLGPRLGRASVAKKSNPLLGMGQLIAPFGRYRIYGMTDGTWNAETVAWPGTSPATPTSGGLVGMDPSAILRTIQYKNRVYGFNGRDRMRNFDGNIWRFAGIGGGTIGALPAPGAVAPVAPAAAATNAVQNITGHGLYNVLSLGSVTIEIVEDTTSWAVLTPGQTITVTLSAVLAGDTISNDPAFTILPNGKGIQTTTTIDVVYADGLTFTVPGALPLSGPRCWIAVSYTGVPASRTFAVLGALPAGVTQAQVAAASVGQSPVVVAVTTAALTGGVAMLTSTAHGLLAGQWVNVTISNANYNGSFLISSVTANTFSYSLFGAGDIASATVTGNATQRTLTGTFYYYLVAANSAHQDTTGRMIEGLPGALSAAVTVTGQTVTIGNIPVSFPDPQVDTINIYRTTDGGFDTELVPEQQDFFLVGSVPIGTTTFLDTVNDDTGWYQSGTNFNRLRFNQNIAPTFKHGAIFGDRFFGAGFDPYVTGTASASGATITFSGATITDGMQGCWFQAANDDNQYVIKVVNNAGSVVLDRPFVGTLSASAFTIFRNPWEVYFSEYMSVEAWGPDGELLRNKLEVPGHEAVTGIIQFEGHLLVFTQTQIYAIVGRGPLRTDIRLLPEPVYNGLGCVNGDAVTRVDNEIHFLSLDGPAMLASIGSAVYFAPQTYGVELNLDWIDKLTYAELRQAVIGSDGRDIFYAVPSAVGQVGNSVVYRYERNTKSWWPETGAVPLVYVRQDGAAGVMDTLFYVQGPLIVQPSSGALDIATQGCVGTLTTHTGIVSAISNGSSLTLNLTPGTNLFVIGDTVNITGAVIGANPNINLPNLPVVDLTTDQITVTLANGMGADYGACGGTVTLAVVNRFVIHDPAAQYGGLDLSEVWVRFYTPAGLLRSSHRIVSSDQNTFTVYSDPTVAGGGPLLASDTTSFQHGDTYALGGVTWTWTTKSIDAVDPLRKTRTHLHKTEEIWVTFDVVDGGVTLSLTNIVDTQVAQNPQIVTGRNLTQKLDVSKSAFEYATVMSSNNGAVVKHLSMRGQVESENV